MSTPLLGAPFKLEVQRQLQVRSLKRASQNLTDKDLAVQHGSTGWARISSGVIIDNDPTAAENNILQGGVLNKINKGFDQSGNDSTYTKSSNIDQSSNLGFRPIPGVESIEIVTKNDTGTLRKTDVAFKVNSLEQLETFEKLYLRPGFTLLLEYGHSAYYDNQENIISDVPSVVDFFKAKNREDIAKKIEEIKRASDYNYDAVLGFGMNFQYSFNMDGGYDCSFYIVSAGSILESIRILSAGDVKNIKVSKSILNETKSKLAFAEQLLAGKKSEASSMDNTSTALKVLNRIYTTTGQRDDQLKTLNDEFPIDLKDGDTPYYLHDVSTDIKNASKKVYITFSTLFKILNNTINIFVDEKRAPLVKFGFNDLETINSAFLTYDDHISTNPHVCILKKEPRNKKLDFAAWAREVKKNLSASGNGNQLYSDILLDVSFLSRTLSGLSDAPETDRTVIDFIQRIFEKVEPALGGINKFDFHYLENVDRENTIEPATLFIVDRKITPVERDISGNVLPCYGKGGLLSNISVTSKISNTIMNMMAIAAQQTATEIEDEGLPLFSFNVGLTDRFKGDLKAQDQGDNEENVNTEYNDKIKEIEKEVEKFVGGRTFNEGDGTGLEQIHNFISKQDIEKSRNPTPGVLPFELDFTMQGIAGLSIGQGFKLQSGILPSKIQETAGFIIKSINHTISGNAWTTDISAFMSITKQDPQKIVKTFLDVPLEQSIKDKITNYIDRTA